MAIKCQQTATISGINSLVCGKLVRIYDIRGNYETIDVLIEGQISPQVGIVGNAFTIGSERYLIQLVSKNVSAGTAVIQLTISDVIVSPPPTIEPAYHLDFYVKPHSWYNVDSAASSIAVRLTDISGMIINEISKAGIIDWQYVKTEVIPEPGINRVTIRTYWNSASAMGIEILVTPIMALALIVGTAIAIVILAIGIPYAYNLYKAEQTLVQHTSTDAEVGALLNDVIKKEKDNCKANFPEDYLGYANCVKSGIQSVTQAGGDFFDNPTIVSNGEAAASNIDSCIEQFNLGKITSTQLDACTNKAADDTTKTITDQTKNKGTDWGSLALIGAGLLGLFIVTKGAKETVTPILVERERRLGGSTT